MGGRQTLSQESYFKSLCWTSSQALTRLSSMYIRKRMRSPQARLLVSCFRRLGLDLPLKPAGRESFCDSLGKPSRVEAQQPPWQHDLCVRSPITSATLHEPRQPAPRDGVTRRRCTLMLCRGQAGLKAQPESDFYVQNFLSFQAGDMRYKAPWPGKVSPQLGLHGKPRRPAAEPMARARQRVRRGVWGLSRDSGN